MKLKKQIQTLRHLPRRAFFAFACFLYCLFTIFSIFAAPILDHAQAATPSTAPIAKNGDQFVQCKATLGLTDISGDSVPHAMQGLLDGSDGNPEDLNSNTAAKATFQHIIDNSGDNYMHIGFSTLNGPGSTPDQRDLYSECNSSIDLYQATSGTKTNFYGLFYPNLDASRLNTSAPFFIAASVNRTAATVTFTIPGQSRVYTNPTTFTIKLGDPNNLLKDRTRWGSGTPTTGDPSDGDCLGTNNQKTCPAKFINAGVIQVGGDTFVATKWTGDGGTGITYSLSHSNDKTRNDTLTGAGGSLCGAVTPTLTLDTDGNGKAHADINIDHNDQQSSFQSFFNEMTVLGTSGHTLDLNYKDYNANCDDIDGTQTVLTPNITIFANYYPGSDEVDLIFTDGGSQESPYIGHYKLDGKSKTSFTISSWDHEADCKTYGMSPPNFTFPSDPSKSKKDDVVRAIWTMPTDNDKCTDSKGTVRVHVESKNAKPPTLDSDKSQDPSNQTLGCDYRLSNPLTWILCPVIQLFTRFAAAGDYIITQQLKVNGNLIFCDSAVSDRAQNTCKAYYEAWSSFRNIALGIMVIGGLVMLIAQSLGLELLDAYTIRKVLPRLLVAAIGITLSWPLMELAVNLTNDLGIGIRELIYAPFADLPNTLHINMGSYGLSTLLGGAGALAGGIGFAAWLYFGGIGVIASLCGTAALAVLVAVLVLVFRQIAITMMIIIAPIAIVCFIMPNTQKVYHVWWESFSKALLMFPMIAGMIATGRVFSAVANSQASTATNSLDGLFYGFAAFIAYFAPYFLIPATFKLAGGALRQIGGFVNDRSRGGFDRLRNGRNERSKKIRETMGHKFNTGDFDNPLAGTRFAGTKLGRGLGGVVKGVNRVGVAKSAGFRGRYGYGGRGAFAKRRIAMEAADAASKESGMQEISDNNAAMRLMALTSGYHGDQHAAEEELRRWYGSDKNEYNRKFVGADLEAKIKEAKDGVGVAGGWNEGRGIAAYLAMHRDGTALRNLQDSADMAAAVSGGDDAMTYRLMSIGGGISKDQKHRPGLHAPQDARSKLAAAATAKRFGGDADAIAGYEDAVRNGTIAAQGGMTMWQFAGSAPAREIRGAMEDNFKILQEYKNDPSSVDPEQAARAAGIILELQAAKDGSATPENKDAIEKALTEGNREQDLLDFIQMQSPIAKSVTSKVSDVATREEKLVVTQVPQTMGELVRGTIGRSADGSGLSDAEKADSISRTQKALEEAQKKAEEQQGK